MFRDFPHFIDVYKAVSGLISEPEDIADLVRGVGARPRRAAACGTSRCRFGPCGRSRRIGMPDAVITEALDVGRAGRAGRARACGSGTSSSFPGRPRARTRGPTLRLALEHPPDGADRVRHRRDRGGARARTRDVIRDVFAAARRGGAALRAARRGDHRRRRRCGRRSTSCTRSGSGTGSGRWTTRALVAYLAERQLPVDVSPTSNVCTRCVPSIAAHPLPSMTRRRACS